MQVCNIIFIVKRLEFLKKGWCTYKLICNQAKLTNRLRALPLFSYSPSRAERKKQAARKLAAQKLVSGRKAKKKGLQTKPQRLTYALLPQRKNAIG